MSAQRLFAQLALFLFALAAAPSLFAQQLPLTMTKSFAPSTVVVGGTSTTTMTVTITNPNQVSISGIAFSDTYPAGLVPDVVGNYTCAAGIATFSGTGWSFSNATLAAGASCSVPMLMHATVTGTITNTTSQVTGTGIPASGPATAVLTVQAPAVVVNAPALSAWALVLLSLAIAGFALLRLRD